MKTFKQFIQEEREIYAKKLGSVPDWSPELAEGNYHVGDVTFSAKDGLGSVPFNQSVYYHGFVAMIRPSVFKQLALADESEERAKDIAKLILNGYAVGIPFLNIDTQAAEEDTGPVKVTGHEGRARMQAIEWANGDEPVPVHIFLGGGTRARHLEGNDMLIAKIKGRLMAEGGKRIVMSPIEEMFLNGKQV
jgi:hypothetical protein